MRILRVVASDWSVPGASACVARARPSSRTHARIDRLAAAWPAAFRAHERRCDRVPERRLLEIVALGPAPRQCVHRGLCARPRRAFFAVQLVEAGTAPEARLDPGPPKAGCPPAHEPSPCPHRASKVHRQRACGRVSTRARLNSRCCGGEAVDSPNTRGIGASRCGVVNTTGGAASHARQTLALKFRPRRQKRAIGGGEKGDLTRPCWVGSR